MVVQERGMRGTKGTRSCIAALVTAVAGSLATGGPGATPLTAQTPSGDQVYTVTDTLPGGVGGVAVDRLGWIYVADFGGTVWRVRPDGRYDTLATGLYGASGNTVDPEGNLLQVSFFGNSVVRIDRHGNQEVFADEGLNGPVGITLDAEGNAYVCNCAANTLSKITPDGVVTTLVESDLLNCPNGITAGGDGNLYVVNFGDGKMLKVTTTGEISELAELPGGGNGHVTFAGGRLYATSFQSHRVYGVSLEGDVSLVAGTGARGGEDGPARTATFAWPNGIAAGPAGDRFYINDFINRFPPTVAMPPAPKSILRMVKLAGLSDRMVAALQSGGLEAMTEAYRVWKADPATGGQFTEVEVNFLGYTLMGQGRLPAALRAFELNAETYPNSFNAWDSLAEAHMNSGHDDRAIELYQKSLELNPANANAVTMIEQIRGRGD